MLLNFSAYDNGTTLAQIDAAWSETGATSFQVSDGLLVPTDTGWNQYLALNTATDGSRSDVTIPAGTAPGSVSVAIRCTPGGAQRYTAAFADQNSKVNLYKTGTWQATIDLTGSFDLATQDAALSIREAAGIVTVVLNGTTIITFDDSANTPLTGGHAGFYLGGYDLATAQRIAAWGDGTAAAPVITTQPVDQLVAASAAVNITLAATGTGTVHYTLQQWVSGAWSDVATSTVAAFAVAAPASGYARYRVRATDDSGETISNVVTIAVAVVGTLLSDRRPHLVDAGFDLRSLVDLGTHGALTEAVLLAEWSDGTIKSTGSLAVVETGADAFAASGQAQLAGALNATEPAADTVSIIVAVLDVGALAVAEQGVDAVAIAGGVLAGATLAVTEAGADVAAAVGAAVVGAALGVAEVGADAAEAAGSTSIVGALASIEATSDTAAAAGTVAIAAALAATESAGDTAAMQASSAAQAVLAITEAGIDTAQATGAATVGAQVNATEAGADVFAAVGVVAEAGSVVGDLAMVEAGTDVAAMAGAVLAQASAAAIETASDDLAAVGAVFAQAALQVAELGADLARAAVALEVHGQLAAIEAGADEFAAAGSTTGTVFAVLQVQELGTDMCSAEAAALVVAVLAADEEPDTMHATGTSDGPPMPTYADDILFVAPRIVERLRAQVPALREVALFDSIDMDRGPRQTPAAIVMFDRELLGSGDDQKRLPKQIVRQRWMVLVAVRSSDQEPGRYGRTAGTYIAGCVRALQGWTPAGTTRPLTRVTSPAPSYGKDTSYFPLAFEQQLVVV